MVTFTPKQLRTILIEAGLTNCEWPGCDQPATELAHIVSTGMGGRASAHTLGNVFMACATHARNSDGLPGDGQTPWDVDKAQVGLILSVMGPVSNNVFRYNPSWWVQEALRRHLKATRGWMETP